jgi:hypothetical protein
MEHNTNYIEVMLDSLRKKIAVLDEIIKVNQKQSELIVDVKKNMVAYESSVEEKQFLIDRLNLLDEGFQTLYNRIQQEILSNAQMHQDEIKEMQLLIGKITDKSIEIQQGEEKNRQIISQQFTDLRREVKSFKDNRIIANKYYNTMQKLDHIPPQFLDKKK